MQSAVLAMIDSICLSVCLSATVRYHVKINQAAIVRHSAASRGSPCDSTALVQLPIQSIYDLNTPS